MSKYAGSKNRTLVVTGAGGFLGRNLVRLALESGWKVRALIHKNNPYVSNHQALTIVKWNLAQVNELSDVFDDAHAVVHLAAYIPSDFHDPQLAIQCYQYNALGTLALLRLVKERDIPHFVYYSAGNAYAIKNVPVVEEDALYPSGRAAFYLSSKIAGEILVEHYRQKHALPATILRISTPYGLGNTSIVNTMINSFKKNVPVNLYSGGCYSADFVYVDDITIATLSAIETKSTGIFNIGSGVRHTIREIADLIVAMQKASINLIKVEPLSDDETIQGYPVLDCSKANQQWGYSPISFKQGLKKMNQNILR